MSADGLETALAAIVDAIAEKVAQRLGGPRRPSHYCATCLPPGCPSWRSAREIALRESIATMRVGRAILIDARAWDEWVATRTSTRAARPALVSPSDQQRLERMGLVLPLARRAGGSR